MNPTQPFDSVCLSMMMMSVRINMPISNYRTQKLVNGSTGRLAFDYNGDREESEYTIVNWADGKLRSVGQHSFDAHVGQMLLQVNTSLIRWPGNAHQQPLGYFVPTHLNIVTLPEEPFVETRRLSDELVAAHLQKYSVRHVPRGRSANALFSPIGSGSTLPSYHYESSPLNRHSLKSTYNQSESIAAGGRSTASLQSLCRAREAYCSFFNSSTGQNEHWCCSGYCIDLLDKLANTLNFTYHLYIVSDLNYGIQKYTDQGIQWNGLVGELLAKKADMAIATLTINPERAKVIDFSKPFKYQGIAMLQRRVGKGARLASFLQPFHGTLWILVLISVHVVAMALYLLDRFSPFGKYKIAITGTHN